LIECYRQGVNTCVVKPVDFGEFAKAVKQPGIFWAAVNEPPPHAAKEENPVQGNEVISTGNQQS
jgi:hypothetical protein